MSKVKTFVVLLIAGLTIAGGLALADPSGSGGGPLKPCQTCRGESPPPPPPAPVTP